MSDYIPDPTNELEPKDKLRPAESAAWEFRALKAHIKYTILPAVTGRAPLESPVFTGIPRAPNPSIGTSDDQIATCAHVAAVAMSAALPGAVSAAGLSISSDGTDWAGRYSVPDAIAVLNYLGF